MDNEINTKSSDLRIFWILIIITAVSGIWGFNNPGRLSQITGIQLQDIRIDSPSILIVVLFISLIVLILGILTDWEFQIGSNRSNITIHSREILLFGSILVFLAAFSFCGLDAVLFLLYYYEIVIFTIYWVVSTTFIPTLIIGIITVIFLFSGCLLVFRKSDLKIFKRTISVDQSSNLLIIGVVSLLLSLLFASLTQPNYDGFLPTIQGLPFGSLVEDSLSGYYLNQEIYLYPLVIFICAFGFLRIALNKPSSPVVTADFVESFGKGYKKVQKASQRFLLFMIFLSVLFFILLGIEFMIGLDGTLQSLFEFQADLFKGVTIFPGFQIGVIPILVLSFILLCLIMLPRAIRPFIDDRVIRYTLRRLLTIIPIFIGVSMISYALMVTTGNPIELMMSAYTFPTGRAEYRELLTRIYGLDAPAQTQWFNWFFHFIMGDMGNSMFGGAHVGTAIAERIGPTLLISVFPLIFTLIIAIPIGVYAAIKQYSKTDNTISILVAVGLSIPIFLFIIVLIILFAYYIPILPASGMSLDQGIAQNVTTLYARIYFETFVQQLFAWETWDLFFHLVIPIVAITMISLVLYVRLVRSGLLEVIRQDYILSAQAYGFPQRTIIWRHALQNVMIPIITFIGLSIGGLLGGAPITETTLGWPGLGRYAVGRFLQYDYPVVMGIIMITAMMILLANLFTDILYTVIDPRVSL